jgi:hypothetical protein
MKWIDYLKKSLKESLVKGIEEPIHALDSMLIYKSRKFDELISIQSRLNELNKDRKKGIIRIDDYDISLNTLRENVIDLINELERSDIEGVAPARNPEEQAVLDTIFKLWKIEEVLIMRIFDDATKMNTQEELLTYTKSRFKELSSGKIYGDKYGWHPIDFTLTLIGISDHKCYFHPDPKQIDTDKSQSVHYRKIVEMKNGAFIWPNNYRSGQFKEFYKISEPENPNKSQESRLTKLYFREIPGLDRIITFEGHINLRSRLPHKK